MRRIATHLDKNNDVVPIYEKAIGNVEEVKARTICVIPWQFASYPLPVGGDCGADEARNLASQ